MELVRRPIVTPGGHSESPCKGSSRNAAVALVADSPDSSSTSDSDEMLAHAAEAGGSQPVSIQTTDSLLRLGITVSSPKKFTAESEDL